MYLPHLELVAYVIYNNYIFVIKTYIFEMYLLVVNFLNLVVNDTLYTIFHS